MSQKLRAKRGEERESPPSERRVSGMEGIHEEAGRKLGHGGGGRQRRWRVAGGMKNMLNRERTK